MPSNVNAQIDSVTGNELPQKSTSGAAHALDALLASSGTVTVGNEVAPTTGTVKNEITKVLADGVTTLVIKYKKISGAVTDNPGIYYVLNSLDATTALNVPTSCHFLAVGDEAIHTFPSTSPLLTLDIKPVGTVANTIFTWEYK